MKKFISLVFVVFVCGCATQLSQEGSTVREIQADWATKCEFIGVLDASEALGWDVADNRRGALNKIRNDVAQLGGNAFVVSDIYSASRAIVQADAYKC